MVLVTTVLGTDRTLLFRAPPQTSRVVRCMCANARKPSLLQFKQEIGMVERLTDEGQLGGIYLGRAHRKFRLRSCWLTIVT